MARVLRGRAAQMAPSDLRERLLRRASFYELICGIIDRAIEELHAPIEAEMANTMVDLPVGTETKD
jgi:hypothetical protein